MREVKSISGKKIIDRSKSRRNLRIGGTDRREHKLIYQKKVERGKKNDRNIKVKMDADRVSD